MAKVQHDRTCRLSFTTMTMRNLRTVQRATKSMAAPTRAYARIARPEPDGLGMIDRDRRGEGG
jgi:hypothetical protein